MTDSVEDRFKELMEGLDLEPPSGAVSVSVLNDLELSSRFNAVKQELLQRGEMVNPTTQAGRDLHSERAAFIIELRRRGMM